MDHPEHLRKHIVIIGGGFAGLAAALELEKLRTQDDHYNVTLIDKNCYHLYHALLYEVATASMDITEKDIEFLQSGVCVRIKALGNILLKKNVEVMQAEVTAVDLIGHKITLADGASIMFDHVIIALGNESNYFNIPGLQENSLTLKDLPDALQIHIQLGKLFKGLMSDEAGFAGKEKKTATVVVGGGGVAGVEIAGELRHYATQLSRQHNIDPSLVTVKIMEAGPTIMAGLGDWVQQTATKRLQSLGVEIHTGQPIISVDTQMVKLKDGTSHGFDLLIWAGGIQAHHLLRNLGVTCAGNKFQICAEPTLQLPGGHNHSYVVGDGMYFVDPVTQRPVPQVAPLAVAEGRLAAGNIYRQIHKQPLQTFVPKHGGFEIPIGGRWAISTLGGINLSGGLAWVIRKWVDLRYLMSILNTADAWKVFWRGGRVYLKND
jgi:NADH dehydrogenase